MLTVRLHPLKPKKGGEVYSVIFRGKLLVERSSDPECDAARALAAKGITGKLAMLDGKTGRPRTVIDIERAALLCVKEGPLRFAPYESRPDRSLTAERVPASPQSPSMLANPLIFQQVSAMNSMT